MRRARPLPNQISTPVKIGAGAAAGFVLAPIVFFGVLAAVWYLAPGEKG